MKRLNLNLLFAIQNNIQLRKAIQLCLILFLGCGIAVCWSLSAVYFVNGSILEWSISYQEWYHEWIPHILWQTLKEETLFRLIPFFTFSILLPRLFEKWWVQALLILISSIAFGSYGAHYFPIIFITGLLFGIIYMLALRVLSVWHLIPFVIVYLVHVFHNTILIVIYCRGVFY